MNFKQSAIFASFAVDDAKKAKDFYGKTLGLDVAEVKGMPELVEIKGPGNAHVMVYAKGADHKPADFTVLNIPVDNIETAMTDLKTKGVKFEVYNNDNIKTDQNGLMRDKDHNMAIAWFKDPAGNVCSIIEDSKAA